MCELIEFDLFFCQTKYLQIGKFTYGFIQKHVQNKRLCRMEVVLVYKTLRCVFFSVSFYQFAVDFFHFLYFIIMFDSICFYAHQIGLRAGLTRHNMVQFYIRFMEGLFSILQLRKIGILDCSWRFELNWFVLRK